MVAHDNGISPQQLNERILDRPHELVLADPEDAKMMADVLDRYAELMKVGYPEKLLHDPDRMVGYMVGHGNAIESREGYNAASLLLTSLNAISHQETLDTILGALLEPGRLPTHSPKLLPELDFHELLYETKEEAHSCARIQAVPAMLVLANLLNNVIWPSDKQIRTHRAENVVRIHVEWKGFALHVGHMLPFAQIPRMSLDAGVTLVRLKIKRSLQLLPQKLTQHVAYAIQAIQGQVHFWHIKRCDPHVLPNATHPVHAGHDEVENSNPNRLYDRQDSVYHGRVARNRVDSAVADPPTVMTRAARARVTATLSAAEHDPQHRATANEQAASSIADANDVKSAAEPESDGDDSAMDDTVASKVPQKRRKRSRRVEESDGEDSPMDDTVASKVPQKRRKRSQRFEDSNGEDSPMEESASSTVRQKRRKRTQRFVHSDSEDSPIDDPVTSTKTSPPPEQATSTPSHVSAITLPPATVAETVRADDAPLPSVERSAKPSGPVQSTRPKPRRRGRTAPDGSSLAAQTPPHPTPQPAAASGPSNGTVTTPEVKVENPTYTLSPAFSPQHAQSTVTPRLYPVTPVTPSVVNREIKQEPGVETRSIKQEPGADIAVGIPSTPTATLTPSSRSLLTSNAPPTPVTPPPRMPISAPSTTPGQRRTFGSLVVGGPDDTQGDAVVPKGEFSRVSDLPDQCEVTKVELQDKLLQGLYVGLACLRTGIFESWSEMVGPGNIVFSAWANVCPSMDFDSIMSAMAFTQSGRFINPTRISPLDLLVRSAPGSGQRLQLYTSDRRPAVCVSTVYCADSCLTVPSTRGLKQKYFSGIFHTQEWERCMAIMCALFRQRVLHAQLYKDAIQFATRAASRARSGEPISCS
ncbi:hypothetical protein MD484_g6192, partial [Candolleomyces efflorescens]